MSHTLDPSCAPVVLMSPLQGVDGDVDVSDAKILCQDRMPFGDGFIHFPGDAAVGDVALGRAAQLGNVESFREIHLEERAAACSQRQKILRGFFRFWNVGAGQGVERCVSVRTASS